MGAAGTGASSTGEIRFRSTPRQWALLVGIVGAAFLVPQLVLALAFANSPAPGQPLLIPTLTFLLVWTVGSWIIYRWQGVTLTRDALHVHNLQARTIRWVDIASVSTDRMLGTTYVIVWEASGRSTLLRAPTTGLLAWDRDFEAKYQTITAWHQALRASADPS